MWLRTYSAVLSKPLHRLFLQATTQNQKFIQMLHTPTASRVIGGATTGIRA